MLRSVNQGSILRTNPLLSSQEPTVKLDEEATLSRETLFQSISNIDNMLKDGGFIFIRDFYSDKRTKNRNHHVLDESVFNYKIPESHASIFLSSGMYTVEWQKIFYDHLGMSTSYKCDNPFNYRWTDVILKKSYNDYYIESKKIE